MAVVSRRAVIFDVDGVLVDSYWAHFQSWIRMFAEVGIEFNERQFRATFGRTNQDIFRELFSAEVSDERAKALSDRKEELYREIIRQDFAPMPGAVELVDQLTEAGYDLGVGSSGPPENVRLTLEQLGRQDAFDAIVTGVDVRRGKPDPQVFLLVAERLGIEPQACIVIEDAPQGIEAANAAGMASVGLVGTATCEALAHANLTVDGLFQLNPDCLAELLVPAMGTIRKAVRSSE